MYDKNFCLDADVLRPDIADEVRDILAKEYDLGNDTSIFGLSVWCRDDQQILVMGKGSKLWCTVKLRFDTMEHKVHLQVKDIQRM